MADIFPTQSRQMFTHDASRFFSRFYPKSALCPASLQTAWSITYPMEQNREWGPPVPKGSSYRAIDLPDTLVYVVTPGYFRAMGMTLRGRDFTWDDGPKSGNVLVLNETVARFLFPGQNPIGRTVIVNGGEAQIVGIIKDVHESNAESQPSWQMYFPATQQGPAGMQLIVRTAMPPSALASSVLHALRELNPNQPAAEFRPIRGIVDRAGSPGVSS